MGRGASALEPKLCHAQCVSGNVRRAGRSEELTTNLKARSYGGWRHEEGKQIPGGSTDDVSS